MTLAARGAPYPWSTGYAWGVATLTREARGTNVALAVHEGTVTLREIEVAGVGMRTLERARRLAGGERFEVLLPASL
jgi:hypothetical protein